uniref:Uncharacterized protein n=1 Tax=virus sp. ctDJ83 TaxID=2827625 RepID=A0A8S5RJQ7_9VIRU|nr:MAG TPA: hypothetical protein [virus sp. ctDJ83]
MAIQETPPTCGAGGVVLRFGGSSMPEDLKARPDLLWRGGVPTQYLSSTNQRQRYR